MNDHQRLAPRPHALRANPINTTVTYTPSALQGATSAFLPKASSTTVSVSPISASPSSAGARFAARAVASQALPPPQDSSSIKPQDLSPERGRLPVAQNAKGTAVAARSVLSSPSIASPKGLHLPERSPSAIAARYASSQSTSPVRSPNRSPNRGLIQRTNTISPGQSSRSLTPDVSGALAGAVASMAAARTDADYHHTPVRSRILDFEKIPQLQTTQHNQLRSTLTTRLKSGQSRLLNDSVPPSLVRGRAQSLETLPVIHKDSVREQISPSPPGNKISARVYIGQDGGSDQARQPSLPVRTSHKGQIPNPRRPDTSPRDHRGMTVNGLADAMVASSLASSRAASPAKRPFPPPQPPALRRKSRSFSALYDLSMKQRATPIERISKPPRPMKHTLRKPSEEDDDEEVAIMKRGRRHWMRKHPNKHREGDRKRWRDKVTEQERKRYEGVFAANRGRFIGPGYFQPSPTALADSTLENNRVVNVIVRDLWERSRLPPDILMEVYDLVAPSEEKALSREQFVVGMWLIDQRLKGRKLPVKVSSSVWSSVRHPDGIKLRKGVM